MIVRIDIEQGHEGLFYATSPDLKGFMVASPSIDAAIAATPAAIIEMYAACEIDVFVAPVQSRDGREQHDFVAVPSVYARSSLTAA